MQVLRAGGHRRMPWKNGGGETFEIAASPTGAALDAIDWRISMAVVGRDGPFSVFPGMDRTLTILDGEGIRLELAGSRAGVDLRRDSAPFAFAADVPAGALLLGGTVTDFNVMTRRDGWRHAVRRLGIEGRLDIRTAAHQAAVFPCLGELQCTATSWSTQRLLPRDCALFRAPPQRISLAAQRPAVLLLVEFYRADA